MNLDILRTEWAQRDAKLESALHLNARLLKAALIDQRRGAILRRLPFGVFDRLIWGVTIALLVAFIAGHAGQPKFLAPAILMLAWTIVTGIVAIRQRVAMQALDYGAAPVTVQKQLEALKVSRITAFKWAFLTGQIVWWIPLAIVAFKGLLGVDLYAVSTFMPKFMALNVVAGLAFIPAAIYLARHLANRFGGSGKLQRLMDALAGEDLVAARGFSAELERFEKE